MGNSDPLEDDKNVLKQVAAAAEVYYNYKNQSQCLNITDGDDIGASMWEYQVLRISERTQNSKTSDGIFFCI